MLPSFRDTIRNPYVLLFLGAVGLFLYALNHDSSQDSGWKDVFWELTRDTGISFIVASLVVFVIEAKSEEDRRRRLDELVTLATDNLESLKQQALDKIGEATSQPLSAFMAKSLPEEWFEYIKDEVDSSDFLRKDLRVSVKVRRLEGYEESYVGIEQSIEFTVINLKKRDGQFIIENFVEHPYVDQLREYTKIKEVLINGTPISQEELAKGVSALDDTFDFHKFSLPHSIDLGKEIHVIVRSECVKAITDRFVWVTTQPSNGLTVEASSYPNSELSCLLSVLHADCKEQWGRVGAPGQVVHSSTKKPVIRNTVLEVSWVSQDMMGEVYRNGIEGRLSE